MRRVVWAGVMWMGVMRPWVALGIEGPPSLQKLVDEMRPSGSSAQSEPPVPSNQPFAPVKIREPGDMGDTGMVIRRSVFKGVVSGTAVAKDAAGTVEISAKDGRQTVSIRAADGAEVHKGPLDGKADLEKVPAAWRDKVRDLEARLRGDGQPPARKPMPPLPQPKPRTARPAPQP